MEAQACVQLRTVCITSIMILPIDVAAHIFGCGCIPPVLVCLEAVQQVPANW